MTPDALLHWIQAHLGPVGAVITAVLGYGAAIVIAATASENALLVGAILGILVALSTLLIRVFVLVDNRVRTEVQRMQAAGELPTALERQENHRNLELLNLKADENAEGIAAILAQLRMEDPR